MIRTLDPWSEVGCQVTSKPPRETPSAPHNHPAGQIPLLFLGCRARPQLGNLGLQPRYLLLLRLHLAVAGEWMLRIVGERFHPVAQLRDVNASRRLRILHAPNLDQAHSFKLELACELPTLLHGLPPAPLNTLTWSLGNQAQASMTW